jgi:hypothetical protein
MVIALFISALLAIAPNAHASLVTYVDESGVKHVVQSADEIPAKFRNKARTVGKSEAAPAVNKFSLEFCSNALMTERKTKLTLLGKEETQLVAGGDPDKDSALKTKLDAKHLQMDEVAEDLKGCNSRYKKEQMK